VPVPFCSGTPWFLPSVAEPIAFKVRVGYKIQVE